MKLLVHLHVFYYNQIDWFIDRLSNISGCQWDLYVTEIRHDRSIEHKFNKLGCKVTYMETENRGYDIWPFIHVIKSVDLDKYDLIMKLHTKGARDRKYKLKGLSIRGLQWRDELVDAMLLSRNRFTRVLRHFQNNPKTGLICSKLCYKKVLSVYPEDTTILLDELDRLGFKGTGKWFCAGTMFIARSLIYRFLQTDIVYAGMFSTASNSCATGTMAHVYERILSMAPLAYSYKVKTLATNIFFSIYIPLSHVLQPFLTWLFSIDRAGKDKTKYLKVFGIRFKLSK